MPSICVSFSFSQFTRLRCGPLLETTPPGSGGGAGIDPGVPNGGGGGAGGDRAELAASIDWSSEEGEPEEKCIPLVRFILLAPSRRLSANELEGVVVGVAMPTDVGVPANVTMGVAAYGGVVACVVLIVVLPPGENCTAAWRAFGRGGYCPSPTVPMEVSGSSTVNGICAITYTHTHTQHYCVALFYFLVPDDWLVPDKACPLEVQW